MDLIDRRQRRAGEHGGDRPAAVLSHRVDFVAGPMADVEAGDDALRNPAAPPEEAVRDPLERRGADDLDAVSQGCA